VVKKRASTKRQELALIGPRKLTRFERARVVGARALQIALGAPVLIDVDPGSMSPIDIATQELEAAALPISIRRTLPDGTSQNIPLKAVVKEES
jgi:DNA-directed RNA polymerase I, II, and III subunit RPABC2